MSSPPIPPKTRAPTLPRRPLDAPAASLGAGPAAIEDLRGELQAWFELSPLGQFMFDESGAVLRHNAALVQTFGAMPPQLRDAAPELRLLIGWPSELPAVAAALTRDGWIAGAAGAPVRVRARVRGVPSNVGGRLPGSAAARWIAMLEDRNVEDERDVARVEIQALMGTAGIGVATWDAARGWLGSTPRGAVDGGEPRGSLMAVGRDLVEPESMAEYDRLQAALRHRTRVEVRYAVRHRESGRRWLMTRVEPAELGPRRGAFSVVTVDVTEEETARRRNHDLLTELTTILDVSPAGIAYLRGGRIVRCNRRFESLLGGRPSCAPGEPFGAALAGAGVPAETVEQVMGAVRGIGALETELLLPAGPSRPAPIWCSLALRRTHEGPPAAAPGGGEPGGGAAPTREGARSEPLSREGGESGGAAASIQETTPGAIGLVVVLADATRLKSQQVELEALARERAGARESLVQQADRTRAILDSVLVGIVTVGDAGIEWMNRSARRMFGGELADFVGVPISVVAGDDPDHPLRRTDYGETLEEGQAETFECLLRARDGRDFWVVGNVVVTGQDTANRQITYALLDIERRRQAEVSIVQARASLQRIIETAPLAIALFDAASQQVLQLNQMAATFAGRPMREIVGRVPSQWLPGPEGATLSADLHRALATPDSVQREFRRETDDADVPRVWDIRIVSLRSAADAPDQILMVASDVTAQRAADEARLAAAIAQREMLIKEVHHRIKNNLQGVAGLLQQSAERHPEAAGAIAEAVGQVHAIAQVHGLQVGMTGPMRVRRVVEAIAASVQRMFGRTIVVEVSGPAPHRFALTEADSIPIALTVNELFTNAIKHSAAAGAAVADIRCRVDCTDDAISIAIANPGRLAPGFSLAAIPGGVSGLGLVRSLLPRKGARMSLDAEGDGVVARLWLAPPAVALLDPL
ncbi:MAG: PAS domain-containing protein [Burkholderiaceae bacterium]